MSVLPGRRIGRLSPFEKGLPQAIGKEVVGPLIGMIIEGVYHQFIRRIPGKGRQQIQNRNTLCLEEGDEFAVNERGVVSRAGGPRHGEDHRPKANPALATEIDHHVEPQPLQLPACGVIVSGCQAIELVVNARHAWGNNSKIQELQ